MDNVVNPDLTEKTLSEKEPKLRTIRPFRIMSGVVKVSNIYDWTSVRLVELYFCRFMDRAARSIDLKKKNEANIIQYGPNRLV